MKSRKISFVRGRWGEEIEGLENDVVRCATRGFGFECGGSLSELRRDLVANVRAFCKFEFIWREGFKEAKTKPQASNFVGFWWTFPTKLSINRTAKASIPRALNFLIDHKQRNKYRNTAGLTDSAYRPFAYPNPPNNFDSSSITGSTSFWSTKATGYFQRSFNNEISLPPLILSPYSCLSHSSSSRSDLEHFVRDNERFTGRKDSRQRIQIT